MTALCTQPASVLAPFCKEGIWAGCVHPNSVYRDSLDGQPFLNVTLVSQFLPGGLGLVSHFLFHTQFCVEGLVEVPSQCARMPSLHLLSTHYVSGYQLGEGPFKSWL